MEKQENFGEEPFGMFTKIVSKIEQSDIDALYQGDIQILCVKNASREDVVKFGELEEQDLYFKKEVPIGTDGNDEDFVWQEEDMLWHSDRAYLQDVHAFCGLYCVAADEGSSPTYFLDSIQAWKDLDEDLKKKVKEEGKVEFSVRNYFDRTNYPHDFRTPVYRRAFLMRSKAKHSMYRKDKFGEYIFYSPGYTSTQYLEELNNSLYQEKNIYTHNWEPGDLVVWNNWTTSHKRDHTPSHVDRRLFRYAFDQKAA